MESVCFGSFVIKIIVILTKCPINSIGMGFERLCCNLLLKTKKVHKMTFLSVKPQAGRIAYPRFTNWFDTILENEFDTVRTPALVNTRETKDSYKIEIAAPGFAKENFKLEVEDQILTISAENTENKTDESEKWTRKEYHFAGFKRSFTLPKTVDADKIKAEYNNGILMLMLPKQEESKAKGTIEIKIS